MAKSAEFLRIAEQLNDESIIVLDEDLGISKPEILNKLIAKAVESGRATAADGIVEAALQREETAPTGLPGGVAIPHCRHEDWLTPSVLFARFTGPTEFTTPDGPADLLFFIGVPENMGGSIHIDILSALAKAIRNKSFRAALRGAETKAEAAGIIDQYVLGKPNGRDAGQHGSSARTGTVTGAKAADTDPSAADQKTPAAAEEPQAPVRIVAITACPTGIAHTYLAADALAGVGDTREDVKIDVETQGSAGIRAVTPEAAANADVVVVAADIGISGLERFGDTPVLKTPIKNAVNSAAKLIDDAVTLARNPQGALTARAAAGTDAGDSAPSETAESKESFAIHIRNAVMTGVSYMIPFVAASGLLIALGFLLGGQNIPSVAEVVTRDFSLVSAWGKGAPIPVDLGDGQIVDFDRGGLLMYLGSVLYVIGNHGMQVIVAILSAFIAYGMAGRSGIAPGFIGGAVAVAVGAGFIGGLVTGILAGLVVAGMLKWRVWPWLEALMPVVVIPLLGTLAVGLAMYLFLGAPLAAAMAGLQNWLNGMGNASALVFGAILGAMMCSDVGGMINKSAYLFATAGLSTADPGAMRIMAAVMAAGMVAPLATSLATVIRPKLFSDGERQNGKAGWMMGAAFISEGAIPFAAADPLRVIPAIMVGGAVTGATSMVLDAATRVPHGGIFVIFAIDNPIQWVISIVVGAVVGAILLVVLKQYTRPQKKAAGATAKANSTAAGAV